VGHQNRGQTQPPAPILRCCRRLLCRAGDNAHHPQLVGLDDSVFTLAAAAKPFKAGAQLTYTLVTLTQQEAGTVLSSEPQRAFHSAICLVAKYAATLSSSICQ